MSDLCRGADEARETDDAKRNVTELELGGGHWWRIPELQFAIMAALLLLVGSLASLWGATPAVSNGVELVAASLGAASFVPEALRGLRCGRLGVGLLITIADVGAVALGHFAEAALLGVLFSTLAGIEQYAVDRTRHSLRAPLSPVTRTASKRYDDAERQIILPSEIAPVDNILWGAGRPGPIEFSVGAHRTTVGS